MNAVCAARSGDAGTNSISLVRPPRLMRGDVERVAQLMRDDDRADVLEVAQLDDLVVDRQRRDRIEAGRRLVVEQDARLAPSARARSRRAGAGRPRAPTASGRAYSPSPTKPEHFVARARRPPRSADSSLRTAGSRRSRARSANRTARLPGTPCRAVRARASDRARTSCRPAARRRRSARVRLQQAEDQPQDRGLARAARAKDDLHVARQQREADRRSGSTLSSNASDTSSNDDGVTGPRRLRSGGDQRRAAISTSIAMSSFVTRKSTRQHRDRRRRPPRSSSRGPTPCVPPFVRRPT